MYLPEQLGHSFLVLLPVYRETLCSDDIVFKVAVHHEPDFQTRFRDLLRSDVLVHEHVIGQSNPRRYSDRRVDS
jgi:hypothetical protein